MCPAILFDPLPGGIAHSLWTVSGQACVLALLALAGERVYRSAPPSFRYWLWMLVLLRLAVPVEFSLPTGMQGYIRDGAVSVAGHFREPSESPEVLSRVTAPRSGIPDPPSGSEPFVFPEQSPAPVSPRPAPLTASSILFPAWVGIALLICGAGLIRSALLRRRLERCAPVDRADLAVLLDHLRRKMGIRRTVELRRMEGEGTLHAPAVSGILRPRIWLPPDIADSWTPEEVEPILLHELTHIRRGDLLVNLLQGVLQAIWFFHPAVWYANREIRRAREEICDDLALSRLASGSRGYARSLLRVAERSSGYSPGLAALALTERKGGAATRIRRILSARYRNAPRLTLRTAALVALIGAAGLSLASPHSGGWGTSRREAGGLPSTSVAGGAAMSMQDHKIVEYAQNEYIAFPAPESGDAGEAVVPHFTGPFQGPGEARSILGGPELTRIQPVPERESDSLHNSLQIRLSPRKTILPGSDRVMVNGDTLSRNTDYRIDYTLGRIILLRPSTFSSAANIEVRYEETAAPAGKAASPEKESLNRAVRFMAANQGEKAIEEFQSFIRQFPRSNEIPRTQYYIALCRFNLHQFARAAELFESCARSYPDSGFAADALFYLADSHYNLGNFEKAVKGFDALIERYPKGGKVEEALFIKAWALLDLREKEKAAETFRRLIREYPNGRFAPGARTALNALEFPGDDSPRTRPQHKDAEKLFEKAMERRQGAAPRTIVPAVGIPARKDFEKASAVRDQAKREKNRTLYHAAAEQFVSVIERYPGSVFTLEAYIQASACYEAAGEPERADVLREKFINASRTGGVVLPPELEPVWPVKK